MRIIQAVIAKCQLYLKARRLGFPLKSTNRYLYCLGPMSLGEARYLDWLAFRTANGIGNKVLPLYEKEGFVASYQLVRHYRSRDYNPFGDYADSDSGHHGDLKLLRIDRVPNELQCEHKIRVSRFCWQCERLKQLAWLSEEDKCHVNCGK